jgi:hypothetical protein
LLSVSNGGDSVVTRLDTTGTGLLTIGAGATLTGGQALTLDSSGNLTFDPTATLSGNTIAVDGSTITFTGQTGAGAAALPGFVVGPTQLAQLAAAQQVILRSAGAMNFDGNVDVTFGNDVDLSAGSFSSDGGAVTINANEVTLSNEIGAPVPTSTAGSGTLTVNANEIDFGTGNKTVNGFDTATFNASGDIVGQGAGTIDFGALPLTMNAPVYVADTGSDSTIKTSGVLDLNAAAGTPLALTPVGGALSFAGGTLNDNGATIEAPAGNVSLEATSGDLTIGSGSLVSAAGVSKQFFDVTISAPAGAITLTSDAGTVNVEAGSTLDFSGASSGGAAGSLTLSAPVQAVQLAGTVKGNAAAGFLGGSFSLNTGGAVDLDNLSAELASSGVNDAITVQTNAGNLSLSAGNTLTAHTVSLTADGGAGGQDPNNGNVQILGTINAAGVDGGEIDLYGKSGVDLEGSLIATGSSATQRGGTVNIGTSAVFDPNEANPYNPTYGYENIGSQNSGAIVLGSGALINVSGGTAGGLSNGTVNFRVPLLADGGVNIIINPFDANKGIIGSRATTLEAYAVWSTTDATTGNQHFDGIVDPAGWYQVAGPNATPQLVAGTFTDQSGNSITYTPGTYDAASGTWTTATLSNDAGASWTKIQADLANDLSNDFFTPEAGDANTAHQQFYGYGGTTTNSDGTVTNTPGTLMGFVQTFDIAATPANGFGNLAIANLVLTPGIELDNPSTAINNGNISIVTNWNLGSGSSPSNLDFRTLDGGAAPIITFRAENSVKVDASLTDGFFQIANPVSPGSSGSVTVGPLQEYASVYSSFNQVQGAFNSSVAYYLTSTAYAGIVTVPIHNFGTDSADEEYYALYQAYINFLTSPLDASLAKFLAVGTTNLNFIADEWTSAPATDTAPTAPTAAQQFANPATYIQYLTEYEAYLVQSSFVSFARLTPPTAPTAQADTVINPSTTASVTLSVATPGVTDNTPSPVATAANPLPLAFASLAGGNSSSFRVVAGADFNSANPIALQATSLFGTADSGSVTMDGHFGYVDSNGLTLMAPTMIRTGTGSINISAANDVSLFDPGDASSLDSGAPGVIYTAGTPAGLQAQGSTVSIVSGSASFADPDILVTPAVNPDAAGDVSIHAGNNINGVEDVTDTTGAITGTPNANISQLWWQWMEIGNPTGLVGTSTQTVQTSIDFGAFDQGVMSVGGNVSVSAGGNITDLAVSLPTTWYLTNTASNPTVNTVGGGNLTVTAGGNILSGDYFVAQGTGTITAGGQIGSDGLVYANIEGSSRQFASSVSTLLATQDGVLDVTARQGANIGAVVDPSYVEDSNLLVDYHQVADEQGYSSTSAVNVTAVTGNVDFGTLGGTTLIGGAGGGSFGVANANDQSTTLPATVNLVSYSGGITVASGGSLFPSATGNLSLIADQSINFTGGGSFAMSDADPSSAASPTDPDPMGKQAHDTTALHADDTVPVRIYSLEGSIVDGTLEPAGAADAGFYNSLISVTVDKPALIEAGQDIVNLVFQGQNLRDADVTRIVAGRDILDTPLPAMTNPTVPSLVLGGPGTFDIEAGRNIGPLTSQEQAFVSGGSNNGFIAGNTGIDAVGNANNPNLPHESASVNVLFGVGPGVDDADFIAAYVNPANAVAGVPSSAQALIAFMEQYDAGQGVDTGLANDKAAAVASVGTLTTAQAWSQFQALPSYVQQLFVEQVFFSVLTDVGNDFNNPASPFANQYARGFQAINTLFPASLGYTANDLSGGSNGANALVDTGNLDIRSTTIQTQQGGNVSILGPGGQALVGSTSAPPEIVGSTGHVIAGPGTQGILTLEQGNIDIFTDQSLLLAQSRVFTEQGGDMTIWSSNGDVNAGKGSTSSANIPPPEYVCDVNHYCTVDAKGEVTGAGIATLQTIPGAPVGDVNLLAPRGTVDAGAAGIRVSGNLNVAALHVANVDNIQVQGKATGIPVVAAVDTGALTAGSAAASAVTQMAQNLVKNNASGVQQRHWIITVQVEGFGDSNNDDDSDAKKKRKPEQVSYDGGSEIAILGYGSVGQTQRAFLTKGEQSKLGGI